MAGKNHFRFWIGLAVSLAALGLATRGIKWDLVAQTLRDARLSWLAAGIILFIASLWITAVRWTVVLQAGKVVRVRDAFSALCIGYLANSILPLRVGDVVRATSLARRGRLPVMRVLGSLAVDRLLDLLTLIIFAAALSVAMDVPPAIRSSLVTMAGATVSAYLLFVTAAARREGMLRLTQRVSARLPEAIGARITGLVEQFLAGLAMLKSVRLLGITFAWSVLAWALSGAAMWLWAPAFNLQIPWYAGVFAMIVINLGSAIPSSPGYIGVYHYLCVLALSLWVNDQDFAMAYAIGTHGLNMGINVILGLVYMWREGLGFGDLSAPQKMRNDGFGREAKE